MMRLDKFLVSAEVGSRSQVKNLIKKGLISVNGIPCKNAEQKIDEEKDWVEYKNDRLYFHKFRYYMLNKPQGVVSATEDNHEKTVMDLLKDSVSVKDFFPVGRLDKDTEGLLLITNDGELAHKLLSPKRHVDKTYLVHLAKPIADHDIQLLEKGVDIGEEKYTLPAKVKKITEMEIHLTIHEGKFHQVKRMVKAIDNEVIYLKRISFGSLTLDEQLFLGDFRALTKSEIEELYGL